MCKNFPVVVRMAYAGSLVLMAEDGDRKVLRLGSAEDPPPLKPPKASDHPILATPPL
jgi:hypothetical protein